MTSDQAVGSVNKGPLSQTFRSFVHSCSLFRALCPLTGQAMDQRKDGFSAISTPPTTTTKSYFNYPSYLWLCSHLPSRGGGLSCCRGR